MIFEEDGGHRGNFFDGKPHGRGLRLCNSGKVTCGIWRHGEQTGYVKHAIKEGESFEGKLVNDMKQGYGKEITINGDKYEGNFELNMRQGEGRMTYKDGS